MANPILNKKITSLRVLKKAIKNAANADEDPKEIRRQMSIFKTLLSWVRCKKNNKEYRKRKSSMQMCIWNFKYLLKRYDRVQ